MSYGPNVQLVITAATLSPLQSLLVGCPTFKSAVLSHLFSQSQEWSISNFPCSLTRKITSHSMKNLALHSLLRSKMIILPILTTSLIHFSLKSWENVLFELGRESGTSRVQTTAVSFRCFSSRCIRWGSLVRRRWLHSICRAPHEKKVGQCVLTLSLPRVINIRFPLQPHQQYNITQYEERGFSSLTQREDDYILPILTTSLIHFSLKGWPNVLFELGS